MKKKPSLYNIGITIACIVLLVLLYRSHYMQASRQTSIPTVSASVPAVTPMQTPAQTPATPTPPMPTPDPWMLEESYYPPFGALPLPVLQQYAGYDAGRTQHFLREENPIDIAFAPYWGQPESTLEENVLASHYRECWEAEALHALDLLAVTENPAADYPIRIPEELRGMLHEFSFMTGELYADTFRDGGTAYSGALTTASAAFLRSYTFFLYDLLAYMNVQPDFVFDAKDVQEEWDYLLQ